MLTNIVTALSMLGIASFYDVKERNVSDYVWIIFGVLGAVLQFFLGSFNAFTFVAATTGSAIALACLYLKLYGPADGLALVALAVILPIHNGLITPLVVLMGASLLSLLFTSILNGFLNLRQLIKTGKLFEEFSEPTHRKIAAFFLVHKRLENERFAFTAEKNNQGRKAFIFFNRADKDFAKESSSYVTSALPLTFFMLLALILILFLPISWSNLFTV